MNKIVIKNVLSVEDGGGGFTIIKTAKTQIFVAADVTMTVDACGESEENSEMVVIVG